ncbi:putative carboxylesterase 15 [Zea mays]|uniref:Putative carboxylesterase 15 n=1 Tax=Zea mays TaxID=4577 RepID=A0A3L6G6M7_MAIZE|nr:putative carboxylesterase 15 [Zea mays]
MPFFGGVARMRSEAECPADTFLDRPLNDRYWRLALPEGTTPDHPVANPFGPGAPPLDVVEFAPTLVVVDGRDLLHDRAVDYAAKLRAARKPVVVRDFHGQQHGFFTIDPWSDASAELMRVIKRFVEAVAEGRGRRRGGGAHGGRWMREPASQVRDERDGIRRGQTQSEN